MKRFLAMIVVSILMVPCTWALDEPENYCDDTAGWANWGELVREHPEDMDLQTLHALRIGLCAKIKEGTISTADAIYVFERARSIIIDGRRMEEMEKEREREKNL